MDQHVSLDTHCISKFRGDIRLAQKKKGGRAMKTPSLIIAFLAVAMVVASPCYAVEPYIKITRAYTTDQNGAETDEFQGGDTVVCRIELTVVGNAGRNYKVLGMIDALGTTAYFNERHTPGEYMLESVHTVSGVPGSMEQCLYKVKLKKRKNGVLELKDADSALSEVAVLE
jgi:hypothetical protein